jgi:hypothetical protein
MKLISVSVAVIGLVLVGSGCSDDKSEQQSTKNAVVNNNPSAHHPKSDNVQSPGEATSSLKKKFSEEFTDACVKREMKNSNNPDVEEKRFKESCACIAEHMANNMAEVDAEKYLDDHEDTQTLDIKFDQAAYFCLQSKPMPKGPHLLGRPQS